MCIAITGIREDGRNEGRAEGRAEGIIKGEELILTLMSRLFAAGRFEDAQKASSDKEYRTLLLSEFGLAN